ncbi:two-component system OmpR family sensor kinase [Microcella putealis]|uniref:histidine kinase n=1 Tax=Microcella putealis TaxID=337005 RepID=A0A4Q7LGV8_9MICO|nr:HAMP domain-containing sensor histidine kinase [Microcella putealis]RZS53464.1 two-component system OmpR family sensor kinase [Microcella putealis]TQM26908.1 two-component system OmpR family sensor kinase [Microcella putealis]
MHEQLSQWWEGISLRSKITGVTVLVVTFGLLVVGTGTLTTLQRTLVDEVDRAIATAADEVTELLTTPDGERAQFSADQFDDFSTLTPSIFSSPFYFGAVAADGTIIDDNVGSGGREQAPDVSRLTLQYVATLDGGVTLTSENRTTQWRVTTFPLTVVTEGDPGSRAQATLVIGADLSNTNSVIGSFASIFLGFGLVVVILSAAITRLLVTTTFRPLREVEATAARFAGGDFSQRLSGATPNTEVGRLNRSLNTMLSRIDRAFADRAETISRMRRFVGDASHELRTPLVSLRGYAELYRMGAIQKEEDVAQAMERIEKEAMRMSSLVSDLLELARLDEQRPLEKSPVDLVPLARDAALDAMAGSPDRDVTVVVDDRRASPSLAMPGDDDVADSPATTRRRASAALARLRPKRRSAAASANAPEIIGRLEVPDLPPVSAVVEGDENKLRQVVTNLIGNALRFTPAGSPIELAVGADEAAGLATIAVVDHGEGIPAQLKEKIFDRFFRADSSRNRDTGGSGLGLAIVSSIVQNHGGRVDVLDTPGGGATFRVSLPLLPTAPARRDDDTFEV